MCLEEIAMLSRFTPLLLAPALLLGGVRDL